MLEDLEAREMAHVDDDLSDALGGAVDLGDALPGLRPQARVLLEDGKIWVEFRLLYCHALRPDWVLDVGIITPH